LLRARNARENADILDRIMYARDASIMQSNENLYYSAFYNCSISAHLFFRIFI